MWSSQRSGCRRCSVRVPTEQGRILQPTLRKRLAVKLGESLQHIDDSPELLLGHLPTEPDLHLVTHATYFMVIVHKEPRDHLLNALCAPVHAQPGDGNHGRPVHCSGNYNTNHALQRAQVQMVARHFRRGASGAGANLWDGKKAPANNKGGRADTGQHGSTRDRSDTLGVQADRSAAHLAGLWTNALHTSGRGIQWSRPRLSTRTPRSKKWNQAAFTKSRVAIRAHDALLHFGSAIPPLEAARAFSSPTSSSACCYDGALSPRWHWHADHGGVVREADHDQHGALRGPVWMTRAACASPRTPSCFICRTPSTPMICRQWEWPVVLLVPGVC